MDIQKQIGKFEKDPTFFLRYKPELHQSLLEIVKNREPDDWIEGMPIWLVSDNLIRKEVAFAPHGLLFISDEVDRFKWAKIAKHEKLEIELVSKGYSPEEAHKIAKTINL